MAQARSARAINRRGKKRGSVTYGTEREDEVRESSFNMTKGGGDEDIETRSLKF